MQVIKIADECACEPFTQAGASYKEFIATIESKSADANATAIQKALRVLCAYYPPEHQPGPWPQPSP